MKTLAAVLDKTGHKPPFNAATPLSVTELELTGPGPSEVLVSITGAGVCHSDLAVVDGTRPWPMPMVLGHEATGIIAGVGSGVTSVSEGDQVVLSYVPACGMCETCVSGRPVLCPDAQSANREGRLSTGTRPFVRDGEKLNTHLGVGAFSEHTVVSERSVIPVDPDVPTEVAAVFGCAVTTGVGAVLNTAQVKEGESVAVFGLGGIGLSVVMGAVLAGASQVIAVDRVSAKIERARELGATGGVNASSLDAVESVRELSGGGVDYAFEAVGSAKVLEQCYRAAGTGGTTVSIGLSPADSEVSINALGLVGMEKTLRGSYMGSARPRADIPRYVSLWKAGKLPVDRLITRGSVPLTDLNVALDRLEAGEDIRQVITP